MAYEKLGLKTGDKLTAEAVGHIESGIAAAETVKGPKGDPGEKGATGATGPAGPKQFTDDEVAKLKVLAAADTGA